MPGGVFSGRGSAAGRVRRFAVALALGLSGGLASACLPGPALDDGGGGGDEGVEGEARVVVVTTDFATGSISLIYPESRRVQRDVALASTDAIPFSHDGLVYVVNRFGHDFVDVYDPDDDWRLLAEHAVSAPGTVSANPHGLAFGPAGRAFLTLHGASEVQIHDFTRPSGTDSLVGAVSTAAFADADGTAETSLAFAAAGQIWVGLSRVDRQRGWTPVPPESLLLIDPAASPPALVDLDPDRPGVQGLELPATWVRQARPDPADPGRIYLLGSALLALDVDTRHIEVVVSEAQMAEAGIGGYLLPQSFDVAPEGDAVFIAAYRADFSAVDIYRVPSEGGVPRSIVTGLNAVERTLEVVGDELWFGDTTPGVSGMRAFDLDGTPLLEDPLSTGLRPYAVTGL